MRGLRRAPDAPEGRHDHGGGGWGPRRTGHPKANGHHTGGGGGGGYEKRDSARRGERMPRRVASVAGYGMASRSPPQGRAPPPPQREGVGGCCEGVGGWEGIARMNNG